MRTFILLIMFLSFISSEAFATRAHVQGGFLLKGDLRSYYKVQNNYKSALDNGDGNIRSGANNREDQNVRSRLQLEVIGFGGPLNIPNRGETRQWLSYARLKFDANDPDSYNNKTDDLDNELAIENAWVRYAPLSWIGIKVGRMSMAPTANAALTYEFLSDLDDDFVLYSAGSLLNKDGFEIDAWLGEGIKVGVAELQGMSRGGRIATNGASSTRAKTRVVYTKIEKPHFAFQLARQYVRSSRTYEDERRRYLYHHIAQNWAAQLRTFPKFQPWVGQQTFWGDKTYQPFAAASVNAAIAATGLSPSASCMLNEHGRGEYDVRSIGFVSKLGNGGFAFERTKYDSPGYCKDNAISPNVELDIHSHAEAWYKPFKNIKVFAFYNTSIHKQDTKLRNDIKAYQKDLAILNSLPAQMQPAVAPVKGAIESYIGALDAQRYTDSTSRGLGVVLNF